MKKTDVVVKHSVIANLIWNLQRLSLSFLNNLRGSSRIKYGMTPLFNNGGFTLIELLVVVLIIGILAAVALPQYKVAVVKSRVSTILPVLQTIVTAQEAYYLANGDYAMIPSLDIEMPSSCTPTGETGANWVCGKDFHVVPLSYGGTIASYCPGYNESITTCIAHRDFYIRQGFAYCQKAGESNCDRTTWVGYVLWTLPKERMCVVQNNSSLGTKICASMGSEMSEEGYYKL